MEEVQSMLEIDKQAQMFIGGADAFEFGVRRIFSNRHLVKKMLISISTGKYSLTLDGFLPVE
jgi:hypothetical protein